ncbi:putative transcription factor C2H2 family [Rosa chinensis]|uniref:RING-type E3 ubiquitin transferase n=1 Tax=Rosa chinensis TaxID=74649 RepID=A0A2P6Q5T1_ROSCH|nr:putative transcription factor C2H2 family [Rosa chinensis]
MWMHQCLTIIDHLLPLFLLMCQKGIHGLYQWPKKFLASRMMQHCRQTTSDSVQEAAGDNPQETSSKCEDPKNKVYTKLELDPIKKAEVELSKPVKSVALVTEEEDVGPDCMEEYDEENLRSATKYDHHFHLACILEWMERSDSCPCAFRK